MRIHDGVLTDAEVAQNFNAEKTGFGYNAGNTYLKTNGQLSLGPVHRYSFDNLSTAGDGTTVVDRVGVGANKADGTIRGTGALPAGTTGVGLPGGSSGSRGVHRLTKRCHFRNFQRRDPYTNASYETWVTVRSNLDWQRIMDFGSSSTGELTGPGGAGTGTNFVFIGANEGLDNVLRLQRTGVGTGVRSDPGYNGLGTEIHLVLTYNAANQEWDMFRNGVLLEGFTSGDGPGTLNDINNWLGRSQFGTDSNADAIYNEFRIYNYALTPDQVQGNFQAGPEVLNVVPEPTSAVLLGIGALAALGARRRRSS